MPLNYVIYLYYLFQFLGDNNSKRARPSYIGYVDLIMYSFSQQIAKGNQRLCITLLIFLHYYTRHLASFYNIYYIRLYGRKDLRITYLLRTEVTEHVGVVDVLLFVLHPDTDVHDVDWLFDLFLEKENDCLDK